MTPEAVEHGVYSKIENSKLKGIILATDGLNYSILGMDAKQVWEKFKNKVQIFLLGKLEQ